MERLESGFFQMPKRLSLPIVLGVFAAFGSLSAHSALLHYKVETLEQQKVHESETLRRMEKTLCKICVGTLGFDSCEASCDK